MEIRKVAEESPVQLYCACQTKSDAPKFFWPYKLFPVSGAHIEPKLCDFWILDSDIFDDTVTNASIIEIEEVRRPDFVVPKDYLGDLERTCDSVKEFDRDYNGHAEILIPLQPPYVQSYERMKEFGSGYFAIGSVRNAALKVDWSATRKGIIDILEQTDCQRIHLFGVSFPEKIVDLAFDERIISCDSRTWFLAATNGKYRQLDGRQVSLKQARGPKSSLACGQRCLASLIDQSLALANPKENGLGKEAWWKLS